MVVIVGLAGVGPTFVSFGNVSIIGSFLVVPLVVGAFAGFALIAGVVDLSIGSMAGLLLGALRGDARGWAGTSGWRWR